MRLKTLEESIEIPAQEIEIKYTPSAAEDTDQSIGWHYLDDQGVKLPINNQRTLNYAIRNRFKIVK